MVPVAAGAAGMLIGPRMVDRGFGGAGDLDSHFRYLSGLLLAVGIGFVSTIPHIERRGDRFLLLTAIVLTGGIGRLISVLLHGVPSSAMLAALVMELGVTPGLALWQQRVAGREW
jgi:Domain of unknown function (DUF4345)